MSWRFWLWWVLASTVGWAVGGGLSGTLGSIQAGYVGGMTVGAAGAGVLQWLVLRRRVARAGWWVLAGGGCWVAGAPIGAVLGGGLSGVLGWSGSGTIDWALTWAGVGAVYGAITGRVLVWLLRRPAAGTAAVAAAA